MSASPRVVNLSSGPDDPLRSVAKTREAIRTRALSATEAVKECLRRIESDEAACLNAFITLTPDTALAEARDLDSRGQLENVGPLCGVPLAIKDNLATAGCRTTAGTAMFADWIPERDAAVVHALRRAGAIVIGKTNMHEAACGVTCKNDHYGMVRNPRGIDRIAGGSSGGSAAAVAGGLCPGSLGSDTGGSVRIPAALCGLVGFKPSIGRWDTAGLVALSRTCDVIGPITRSVEDAQLMSASITGDTTEASGVATGVRSVRVASLTDHFDDTDDETAAVMEDFRNLLTSAGAILSRATLDGADAAMDAGFSIVVPEAWVLVQQLVSIARPGARLIDHLGEFGPGPRETFGGEAESPVLARDYVQAMWKTRPALQAAFGEALVEADFLICATTPSPAVLHEEDPDMLFNGTQAPTFTTFIRNCVAISVAGLPAISIPIGETAQGLPVGAQIIGRVGHDNSLLRFAAACESLRAG